MKIPGLLCIVFLAAWPGVGCPQEVGDSAWSFGFALGSLRPEDSTGKLKNQGGQYALALDSTYRLSGNWYLGADLFAYGQRFDTPPSVVPPAFGTVDGRAHVAGGSLGVVVKYSVPVGRLDAYVGGGAGVYFNSMRVTGSTFGLPAHGEVRDDRIGQQILAGISYRIGNDWSVGIEWRRIFLQANFGALSNGPVDLGGDSYMIAFRSAWQAIM